MSSWRARTGSLLTIVLSVLATVATTSTPAAAAPTAAGPVATATTSATGSELQVGFNGRIEQIAQIGQFYQPGERRLCQWYTGWSNAVGAAEGTPLHPTGWAGTLDWFRNAEVQGCDEVLVSFKALSSGDPAGEFDPEPPTEAEYGAALEAFLDTDWVGLTGYSGDFVVAPWNEPNLNAGDANGYPSTHGSVSIIGPRLAARYYLTAERICASRGCLVTAGNLASNGGKEADSRTQCQTAIVPRDQLCDQPSQYATAGTAPSYLDQYRNEIVNAAPEFGFPATFRPKQVAYHGWADSNSYLRGERTCTNYEDCLLEKVLFAFRGSWHAAEIWNTEDGIGQPGFFTSDFITDEVQTDGIAHLMSIAARSPGVTRLYYTHLIGSPSRLLDTADGQVTRRRPALCMLQDRSQVVDLSPC